MLGMSPKRGKQEKVIHTRISESLEQELREHASRLGVSVSNLVRNILLATVDRVEGAVVEGANMARSATGGAAARAARTAEASAGEPLGWQVLYLGKNALCSRCNAILPRGSSAGIAVSTTGLDPDHIVCPACLDTLRSQPD